MKQLARKCITKIKPYKPGKPIEEVERELGLEGVVKLASNENPIGPSPKALRAIRNSLPEVNRYPDGGAYYLKKKLAAKLRVGERNLILGNGSDEIIVFAVRAFVNEGEEVIIAKPTFLIYELAALSRGAKIKYVPLKNFRYDLRAMRKAVSRRTKLIFVANPDNPTGSYVTKKEVDEFLKGLPKDVIVFFDEAYRELVTERDYPDTLQYLNRRNLIIIRSFSKAYGLAGLRIGYGISSPKLVSYMDKVREPFNVNSLAQAGALAALDDAEHLKKVRSAITKGKKYLYKNFKKMNLSYVPSAANFVLVDVKTDGRKIFQKMLKLGVIVRDMKAWKLNNFIRVTIGTERENKKFVAALKKVLAKKS